MTEISRQQIAIDQRKRIPDNWLKEMNDWPNDSLNSAASDDQVDPQLRIYAQWEGDYRDAFGIFVDRDPAGDLRRTHARNEAEKAFIVDRADREAEELHSRVAAFKERALKLSQGG